jgi:uncharacterized protein YjbJ (UPF0337 family)
MARVLHGLSTRSDDHASGVACKESNMNWEQIQGNWKQFTGKIKEQWGKLTDDDLDVIAGDKDQLVGKVQEQYGIAKDEAAKEVDRWGEKVRDDDLPKYQ